MRQVLRSAERSWRPAPTRPSTSASMMICSTASATERRKSSSPLFASSSAKGSLSSVIGVVLGAWVKRQTPPCPMIPVTTALNDAEGGVRSTSSATIGAPGNYTITVDATAASWRARPQRLAADGDGPRGAHPPPVVPIRPVEDQPRGTDSPSTPPWVAPISQPRERRCLSWTLVHL